MNIRYTRRALADLDAILSHIEDRSPTGAINVKARLKALVELLSEHPRIGRSTGKADVRRVVATPHPYLIFYRATEGEVVVLGIRHAARGPVR